MTASTVIIAAQFALLIAILIVLLRRDRGASDELTRRIAEIQTLTARLEPTLREELKSSRVEMADQGQQARTEVSGESRSLREEFLRTVNIFGERNTPTCRGLGPRHEQAEAANHLRESIHGTLVALGGELREGSKQLSQSVHERLAEVAAKVGDLTNSNDQKLNTIREQVAGQLDDLRAQQAKSSEQLTESVQANFARLAGDLRDTQRLLNESVQQRLTEMSGKVSELSGANERSQEALRTSVEQKLDKLNQSNSQKLEEVRVTVDEKLHSTLEKRLTDSFGLVSDRLGNVQRGLGEMKDLATGVGDLKRV